MHKVIDFIKSNYFLALQLFITNFKLRYKNSILGIAWVLVKPTLTFAVLYVVWSLLRGKTDPQYPLQLLIGLIVFGYANELLLLGTRSLVDRSNVILKINFPRQIALMSSLAVAVVDLVLNLFLFVVLSLVIHTQVNLVSVMYFGAIVLTTLLLFLGIGFFVSILYVRMRDLTNIFELGLYLLFWGTPIFYEKELILAENNSKILNLWFEINPLGLIVESSQGALIEGEILNSKGLLLLFLISIFLIATGNYYFNSQIKKVSEFM